MISGYSRLYIRMTAESHLIQAQKIKQKRFKQIQDFFSMEKEQVDIIIRLLWHYKKSYPIGICADDVIKLLVEQSKFIFYKDKTYIIHLLNTLSYLGILEIHKDDRSYDITAFGLEYWMDSQKK